MKVEWEKDYRPPLKAQHDFEKEVLRVKKLELSKMTEARDKMISKPITIEDDKFFVEKCLKGIGTDGMDIDIVIEKCGREELEKMINEENIHEMNNQIEYLEEQCKRKKASQFVFAHLYNENVEQAIPYFHKYKDTLYRQIEDPEKCCQATIFEDYMDKKCQQKEKLTNEGAYLAICDHNKHVILSIEKTIGFLTSYTTAKEVLKAGKKMNKRKGKKNRGKK